MCLPPFHRLAPVEIAERAAKPDRDDIGLARVGRRGLERGQRARDLAALVGEPALRMHAGIAEAAFVHDQDRGLADAVGQPRQRQRLEARPAARRQQALAARDLLQELDDHAAVVDRRAVGQHETGHLAERVLLPQRVVLVERVGGQHGDALAQAQHVDRHAHLAPERRGRRRAQDEFFGSSGQDFHCAIFEPARRLP